MNHSPCSFRVVLGTLAIAWMSVVNFSFADFEATHKQAYTIQPQLPGVTLELQTTCLGPRGLVYMACRVKPSNASDPSNSSSQGASGKGDNTGMIMVYDPSGLLFFSFPLPFVPTAMNFSPSSRLYVAGAGNVARVALNGTIEVEIAAETILNRDASTFKQSIRFTSLAAGNDEVYVAGTDSSDAEYGVWRLSPDLTFEKRIIHDAKGCGGQFDIQTDGTRLLVAESAKHQVATYDRDGKLVSRFGKQSEEAQDGFAGGCNPMNIRCLSDGDILTIEAGSGELKRFSRAGKLVGFPGVGKISDKCKQIAVDYDPDRNYYYVMNQERSEVGILVLKEEAPE